MKRCIIPLMVMLLLLSACNIPKPQHSTHEDLPENSSEVLHENLPEILPDNSSVITSNNLSDSLSVSDFEKTDTHPEQEKNAVSDKDRLQKLLNTISPITDYSLLRMVNDFYSIAIPAALASDHDTALEQLTAMQIEINSVLGSIIYSEAPSGYAIVDDWDDLSGSCRSLRNNIADAIIALQDNDAARVIELRDFAGNTNIVKEALFVQNTLLNSITKLQEKEDKLNIKANFSYNECMAKAAKYARYHFDNTRITENDLIGNNTPVVFDDIPGKHYSFNLYGNDNVFILISVSDCSIICRETIPGGYRNSFINDASLPSENDDVSMPDIIATDYDSATSLLKSMAVAYEENFMDTDNVPEGHIAHCYPSPGNAIPDGYVVKIFIEI